MKVQGSVALVTGANRGIGKAIAEELLNRGAAKVYAAVRNPSTVTDSRLTPLQLDVTDSARFAQLAQELTDVTLVVNNAGIGRPGLPLQASLDDARAELETNYLSVISSTQAFAPVLAANGGGAFINVLSALSWITVPFLATYSPSKSAAWSYTNASRMQLKHQNTEVVGVHVNFVDTRSRAPCPTITTCSIRRSRPSSRSLRSGLAYPFAVTRPGEEQQHVEKRRHPIVGRTETCARTLQTRV